VQSPSIGRARLHTTQSPCVRITRSHSSRPSSPRPSLVFCFILPLFFLATFHFSTEDSFPHVFEPSWCAIPFYWPRSAPHNPVSVRADHPFAFFSSLFAQKTVGPCSLPQNLVVPLPALGKKGGAVTTDSPCSCTAESRDCRARSSLHVGDRYPLASRRSWCPTSSRMSVPRPLLFFLLSFALSGCMCYS
jgi:hypothetical protein